ncbi:MAG TPA: FxsA family protein [Alphaproteobacteria bacterium]
MLIFLIIPLMEIATFWVVGDEIGALWTIALCIFSVMAGTALVRYQGMTVLIDARRAMIEGRQPAQEIFDGICLAVAGVLLIVPGFLTDMLAFALLVPAVRERLRRRMGRPPTSAQNNDDAIDVDFERIDDDPA